MLIFIPDRPRGVADLWEFDGTMSWQVTDPLEWQTRNRQRGLEAVTDGAVARPPSVQVSGVMTATPTRVSATNPSESFVGPTRLADEHSRLVDMRNRRETGVLLLPDHPPLTSVVMGGITSGRSAAARKNSYDVAFHKVNVVDLLTTAPVVDADAAALGANGVQDLGVV